MYHLSYNAFSSTHRLFLSLSLSLSLSLDTNTYLVRLAHEQVHLYVNVYAHTCVFSNRHMIDSYSFPFVSISFPELSAKGAWHTAAVYTHDDVKEVVEYVNLLAV